jgi:predicted ATPase
LAVAPVHCGFTEGFDTADLKDGRALLDELDAVRRIDALNRIPIRVRL